MENLKSKALRAFAWDYSGNFMHHGVSFVLSIFLARLLSPADFGLLAMAFVFISFSQAFMDFGLNSALVQKKNPTEEQYSTIFYIKVFLGCILTLLLISFSGLIGDFYDNPEIAKIGRVLSILFIINGISSVQSVQLKKKLDFRSLTKARIISTMISGIVGVTLALHGFGVWSLVARSILDALMQLALIWSFSSWRPKFIFNLKSIRGLWNYGYKMFLSGLLNTIYERIDVLIIGKVFSATSLGFFYRAKSFNQIIIQSSSASLIKVLFPVFSELQNNLPKVRNIVIKSLNVLSFVVFGLMGLLYITAEDVIVLLFSEKWLPSVPLFKLLIFSAYCYPVSAVLVNVIQGLGNSTAFLKLEIIKKVPLSIAIPVGFLFGIEGYLIALAINGIISVLLNMFFVEKQIDLSIIDQMRHVFIYLLPALISTVPIYYLAAILPDATLLKIFICVVLFAGIYFSTNLLLKTKGIVYAIDLIPQRFRKRAPVGYLIKIGGL